MKNLGEVTQEHAIEIIKAGYPLFFKSGKWVLEDRSKEIGEPTKHLSSTRKAYFFWFNDDDIEIVNEENELGIEAHNYDVCYKCYVKAAELGYYIPLLSELINKK